MTNRFTPMSTNAAGGWLFVSGGLQYLSQIDGNRGAEASAIPLEAMRGSSWGNTAVFNPGSDESRTGEMFTNLATAPPVPYTNVIAAVIPINATIPVPTNFPANNPPLTNFPSVYVYGFVSDPLVNKFRVTGR